MYFLLGLLACGLTSIAQSSFKFAFVTDTHVGSETGAADLSRTVQDINADPTLKFVVLTGDITEFGADSEIKLAKSILDSLNKPWYIIPGNHDANWSESGSNTFKKIFGAETFAFQYGGYGFVATACGPNMRMGPGQVPRENIVWLDSILKTPAYKNIPLVFLNHYPQDSALNNWYDVLDRLKQTNVQLILCGHGHNNHNLNFENIPSVMGRSNLRAGKPVGGYNIVSFDNGMATFTEKTPGTTITKQWNEVKLYDHHFKAETATYPRPSYALNSTYSNVKEVWQYQDDSDIGSGVAVTGNLVIGSDTNGWLFALDKKTGKKKWAFRTQGKIYATPAVSGDYVVIASSDNNVYCVNVNTGKQVWQFATLKPDIACPVIKNDIVYVGGSDGHFRALALATGKLKWDFAEVKGFVVTKPLIYQDKIYFGCWANDFYALDITTGKLAWKWNNGASNRMFSPAACYPAGTNNRIFIVAPDRYMTSLNATTGEVIWRKQIPTVRVRESMGLSNDSSLVYVKTMEGNVYGVSTTADTMQLNWKANVALGYEICPTAIVEKEGVVYVPTNSGLVAAIDSKTANVLWQHKISNALVSSIYALGNKALVVTTMDGKITYINF